MSTKQKKSAEKTEKKKEKVTPEETETEEVMEVKANDKKPKGRRSRYR